MDAKRCSKCGEWQSVAEFYKKPSGRDGLISQCKHCVSESGRQYRKLNRDRRRTASAAYRKRNRERNSDPDKRRIVESKRCCTCRENKLASEFSRNGSTPDGLQSKCKKCVSEYRVEYNERNRDLIRKRRAESYERNRDAARDRRRDWYERNREHVLEYQREYVNQNYEAVRERSREYYRNNRDRIRESRREYNAAYLARCGMEMRQRQYDKQNQSATWSTHNGLEWTPAEDAVVLLEGMTDVEKSVALKRTLLAIRGRRFVLRHKGPNNDPH